MSQANGQSVLSDAIDAVVALLGPTAQRTRLDQLGAENLPAENVIPDDEAAESTNATATDLKGRFAVRYEVAEASCADEAADAQFVGGTKLILADPTLGGLVRVTRLVGRKWDRDQGRVEIVACVATYEIEYSTNPRDPSIAGI